MYFMNHSFKLLKYSPYILKIIKENNPTKEDYLVIAPIFNHLEEALSPLLYIYI